MMPAKKMLLQVGLWRVLNAEANRLRGEPLTSANVDKYRRACSQKCSQFSFFGPWIVPFHLWKRRGRESNPRIDWRLGIDPVPREKYTVAIDGQEQPASE